ncbi:MAG: anti-sigma factor family protein, partial [Thermomicrobiales bacterium]
MSTTDDQNPDGPITPASQPEADDVILSEETAVLGGAPVESGSTRTQHDLAAAYVLDALTQAERVAYEAHIVDCIDCEQRIAELKRIADLLPNALIVPPSELPDAYPFLLRDVAHETLPISSTLPSTLAESEEDESEELDPATPDVESKPSIEDEPDGITPVTPLDQVETAEDAPEIDDEPGESEIVVAEAVPEQIGTDEPSPDIDDEPLDIAPSRPVRQPRPPGRIRPGIRPPGGPAVTVANQRVALRATPTVIAFS